MIKKFKGYFFLLRYASKFSNFVWFSILDGIIWGIYRSIVSFYFIKIIFNKIETNSPFDEVLIYTGIMVVYFLFCYVCHEFYWNFAEPKARQQIHENMHTELFQKALNMDISCYDDPDFYNEYIWFLNEADTRVMNVACDLSKFINRICSTLVIIGIMFTIDPIVIATIMLSIALSIFMKMIKTKLVYQRDVELIQEQRKIDYVGRIFYLKDYAKEVRLSKIKDVLIDKLDESIDKKIDIYKKYQGKMFLTVFFSDTLMSLLIQIGIIILLVYKIIVLKELSVGDFAVSFVGMSSLFWHLNDLMGYVVMLREHSLYAEKMMRFLSYQPTIKNIETCVRVPEKFNQITIKNLSFRYHDKGEFVLKDINMTIGRNEKIAIVGLNGSGKTTLVKLICRLYDPTEGIIQMNDLDIKQYNLKDYRQNYGLVFQDFQIFAASLAENVKADLIENDKEKVAIKKVLERSGFGKRLASLENGVDEELGNEFNTSGVNLSGGENQKIAIARTLIRNSELIILDEPSSALDPVSEYELNQTMMSASLDKTVIFVSHRLSTTRMADKIFLFQNGRIIESGSHDELMKLNKTYAYMFQLQAQNYLSEE